MTQYIDKDALVAEIERLARLLPKEEGLSMNLDWARNTLSCLYGFLNTLEVKEVDFENAYKEFVEDDYVYSKLVNNIVGKAIAKHFFELGLKAQKGE